MKKKTKKEYGDYYLGLDLGTSSVGWAVTDTDYNVLRFNRKSMWGIRLFEEAQTAESRRLSRGARRRTGRRTERIKLLEEMFSGEISNVDEAFFLRMKESKFLKEDKDERVRQSNTLFYDEKYTDKDYHKEFPTIYHLRKALIEGKKKFDIRLYYLAIHHIMKKRGHFLFEENTIGSVTSFENVFEELKDFLKDEYDMDFDCQDVVEVQKIIKDRQTGIQKKTNELVKQFNLAQSEKMKRSILRLISGAKVSLKDLFQEEGLAELDVKSISFRDANFEDNIASIEAQASDKIYMLEKIKTLYDWGILADILGENEKYISFYKVKIYEKHKRDLAVLKKIIRDKDGVYGCFTKEDYKNVFNLHDPSKVNYVAYVGTSSNNGKIKPSVSNKNKKSEGDYQEKICKYLLTYINRITGEQIDDDVLYVKKELEAHTFLPKQVSQDNSVIPRQLNFEELKLILNNMEKQYRFVLEKDEEGYATRDKIEKLFNFRIPYYVGPLNDAHADKEDYTKGNCWIKKHKEVKIYPWNFNEVVDLDTSAERFIKRMTNKCTYLVGEDVLPKDSLLYSEFMVLNELNNLKINQEEISVELKNKIFEEVFKNEAIRGKVTLKKLTDYLIREGEFDKDDTYELSGIDGEFKSSLTSYRDMRSILGTKVDTDREMVEDIIVGIVLFGEDKKLLKMRLEKKYKEANRLTGNEITQICKKSYRDWGRLSNRFLSGIQGVNVKTGEFGTIHQLMKTTNCNLMELLSANYTFLEEIEKERIDLNESDKKITYEMVDELYVSPSVKRMIWQSLSIVHEIVKIIGHDPKKVFVEMAREKTDNGRTISRKNKFLDLYNNCKKEEREWKKELENTPESKFRSIKLYLYYTQMGKCMYCGKAIDLHEISNANLYDRDHIYPQSKTKDDSLDNLVFVCREHNAKKSNTYPLSKEFQEKMQATWAILCKNGFISKEKYDRLTRKTPLSDEELARFIARQLVETRQSTKAVAEILGKVFDKEKVVYVKAGNVSEFRRINRFTKVRSVNDYHHAHDAYMNIIVGNVYETKFTRNPLNFIKGTARGSYSLKRMYDSDVERGGVVAWKRGKKGTIKTVNEVIYQDLSKRGNIQFTRYAREAKGEIFDVNILKKGKGQIPIKGSEPRMSIDKFGGYNKAAGAYFMLVESHVKGKRNRSIEYVPIYLAKQIEESMVAKVKYCEEMLKLINPKILIDKIKIDSLINIDGFPMHISGRQNDRLVLKGAVQLVLSQEEMSYWKRIEKYISRNILRKGKDNLKITEYDKTTKVENMESYDKLLNKHKKTIYEKRPAGQVKIIEEGRNLFVDLSIEEQVIVLNEILYLYQCNSVASNFKNIKGGTRSGIMTISKDITNRKSAKIIHQSPTGLFQKEIDLLKI